MASKKSEKKSELKSELNEGPKYDIWEWQVVTRSAVEGVDANPGGPEAGITEAINQGYRPTTDEPWLTGPEDHADGTSQVFTWHIPVEKAKSAPAEQPGNVPEPAALKSDVSKNKE